MRSGAPLLALLAFAFLLRIIVPAGWMPAHGEIGFVPCPLAAPVAAPVEVAHGGHHDAHAAHHDTAEPDQAPPSNDHGEKKGCDFAPLGLAWAAPDQPAFDLTPVFAEAQVFAALPHVAVGQGLAAPPPPSTGPPAFA